MKRPWLGFVVSTFGREDYLRALIESIRHSCSDVPYEIVCVASDLRDSGKIQWLAEQEDITLIALGDRRQGGRRKQSLYYYENLGLLASKAEWLLVTNDDTRVTRPLVQELREREQNFDIFVIPGELGDASLGKRAPEIGRLTFPDGGHSPILLFDFTVIRRHVYVEIGFLDEGLDWFGKGLDLAIRASIDRRYRIGVMERGFVDHFIASEGRRPPHPRRDFRYLKSKWSIGSSLESGIVVETW